ncbi:MAG: tRNA (adenosine(37)-N6)-dimethylallyltransferase MiaA [Pseudomonadota bacterium]
MGPTASGKTDLAVELAGRLDCELISVDATLVYRGLDIGSAKPVYPHHLIDIRDPAERYSAAEFVLDTVRLCRDITERGRTPLLVGGTMLYFRAFLFGLAEMPPADSDVRASIAREAELLGWPALHARLADVDPASAAKIHPNHSQRISRALEVYRASGVALSDWHARGPSADTWLNPFDHFRVVQLAIAPAQREILHERIERRLHLMMAAGLVGEVQQLRLRRDLHTDLPALRAVGYRQIWRYLAGESDFATAQAQTLAATRQLAKRQLTWLRKWPDLSWIYTDHQGNLARTEESEELWDDLAGKPLNLAMHYLQGPSL